MKYVFIFLAILLLILLAIGFIMYTQISYPNHQKRDDQKKFNKENGYDKGIEQLERIPFELELRDGYTIHGDFSKNNSNKYVILMHGHTSTREGVIPIALPFFELGYNVLVFDVRAFGDNKYCDCTMGKKESKDLVEIIDYVYKRFGKDIYLGIFGVSLGGASVLLSLRYTQNIKFVVSDCPYASTYKLGLDILKNRKIPFPFIFMPFIEFWCIILSHFSFRGTSCINSIQNNKVPLLLIHGTSDTFIYPYHSQNIYEKATCYKEIKLFDGAIHARSILKDRNKYKKTLKDFLDHLGG